MTYAIGSGDLDTPSEQLLLGYFGTNGTDGLFDADQVLKVMLGPANEITNAEFNKATDGTAGGDDLALHLARRLYEGNAQLTYDDLRRYMTGTNSQGLTGYGPKLWEMIFADQLKCTKENIEGALGIGLPGGEGRYNFWDDSGDYLHAALTLANEMHSQGVVDLDWDSLWAFFDAKVTRAGELALRPDTVWGDGGGSWGSWDDAADDALSDYACDGVSGMVFKLVRLMMALKYYDGEGS